MSKESLQMGEQFSATVVPAAQPPEVKTRHYVIGYGVILAAIAGVCYWVFF